MGGVTDQLETLKSASKAKDRKSAESALDVLGARHRAALDFLALPQADARECGDALEREMGRVRELSLGISLLEEVSLRTSDAILSMGELISSRLVAAALRARGVPAVWVDPRRLVATDATYGGAVPDEAETGRRVGAVALPELSAGTVVVTGGFLGEAPDGSTTTLGRGGSDYSAALLGAALADAGADVPVIEIWTDVDGILTADPRIVPAARLVPEVGYAEAAELSFFGAKVLHPATIRPAVARGIPVAVRNTFRPEVAGTVVKADAPGHGVRAVAMRKGVAALFVGSPRMLFAHGYAARVFTVFEKHRRPGRRHRDERGLDLDHGRREGAARPPRREPLGVRRGLDPPEPRGRLRRREGAPDDAGRRGAGLRGARRRQRRPDLAGSLGHEHHVRRRREGRPRGAPAASPGLLRRGRGMRALIVGYGKMGKAIEAALAARGHLIAGKIDEGEDRGIS